jgi:hypothetical protein
MALAKARTSMHNAEAIVETSEKDSIGASSVIWPKFLINLIICYLSMTADRIQPQFAKNGYICLRLIDRRMKFLIDQAGCVVSNMVICSYPRKLTGMLHYIHSRIKLENLRVLRLNIRWIRSRELSPHNRRDILFDCLRALKDNSLITLYLFFNLDFYTNDDLAHCVVELLSVKTLRTFELHFSQYSLITEGGFSAIVNALCRCQKLSNVFLAFDKSPGLDAINNGRKALKFFLKKECRSNRKMIHSKGFLGEREHYGWAENTFEDEQLVW